MLTIDLNKLEEIGLIVEYSPSTNVLTIETQTVLQVDQTAIDFYGYLSEVGMTEESIQRVIEYTNREYLVSMVNSVMDTHEAGKLRF